MYFSSMLRFSKTKIKERYCHHFPKTKPMLHFKYSILVTALSSLESLNHESKLTFQKESFHLSYLMYIIISRVLLNHLWWSMTWIIVLEGQRQKNLEDYRCGWYIEHLLIMYKTMCPFFSTIKRKPEKIQWYCSRNWIVSIHLMISSSKQSSSNFHLQYFNSYV